MNVRKTLDQLVRYGFVGVASNVVGYAVYLVITHAGMGPKLAMSLLYAVGVTLAFLGHRRWTFAHRGSSIVSARRFLCTYFLGYLLNLALLYVFVDHLGYSHQWIQAAAIVLLAVFLFACMKLWVFSATQDATI